MPSLTEKIKQIKAEFPELLRLGQVQAIACLFGHTRYTVKAMSARLPVVVLGYVAPGCKTARAFYDRDKTIDLFLPSQS